MRRKPVLGLGLAVLALCGGFWLGNLPTTDAAAPDQQAQQSQSQQSQGQQQQQGGNPFPGLIDELKGIEGCLGVETAQTQSGKNVIFAWFEDKAAAMRWYESEYHQTMMYRFFPNQEFGEAMEDIADDSGPIMAIASITPATDAKIGQLPISQIAIELYGPLKGGLNFGGTFAPAAVQEKLEQRETAAAAGGN